ncbi:MAG: hypothetical protein ACLP7Q_00860 [Isosphaeraceae bacterium]
MIVIVSSRYFRARSIDSTAHAYRGATKIRTAFSVRSLVRASRADDASSLKGTFMKGLFAGSTVALLMISASLLWSPNARGGQPPKAAQSEDVGQALNSYEERKLDHCHKELDNAKKELHELLDLRLMMLHTLAEERLKLQMAVAGVPSGHSDAAHSCAEHNAVLAKELFQIHSALQIEIEAEHKHIAELGSQIHSLKEQIEKAQHPQKVAETKSAASPQPAKTVAHKAVVSGKPNAASGGNDTP